MAVSPNGSTDTGRRISLFGQRVREIRMARGLSQSVIARRAGISPGYVGLIETGERGEKPSLENVKRLAQALECTIDETESLMRAGHHLGEHEHLIDGDRPTVIGMIEADPIMTAEQKQIVIGVFRAFRPDA